MNRIIRVLVAVTLVFVLVVNVSPIRVQASALPEVAGVVTEIIPFAKVVEPAALGVGGTVFCWVAAGLGIIFTAAQAVKAYNEYQDFTGDLGTSIYYYPDGSWSYGVDMTFVERVRAFLWDEGFIVSSNVNIPLSSGQFLDMGNGFNKGFGTDGSGFGVKWYHGTLQSDGTYRCCPHWTLISIAHFTEVCDYGSDGKLKGTSVGTCDAIVVDGTTYYYRGNSNHEWFTYPDKTSSFFAGAFDSTGLTTNISSIVRYAVGGSLTDGVESPYDFELGQVSLPDVPMSDGYPEWHTNARPAVNPDTQEEITVLPIPLVPSADPETQIGSLTQPDIWQGSVAEPFPDTGTSPDGSIAETPWNDVQDWLTPSGDPGRFGLQLRDYFPFCIPFDLYDFFTVLAAEPEAPCFVWEVPVPQMGRTFTVEVDLSAWDSVAALFRKLELLAFIVGLGWVTREKIRG